MEKKSETERVVNSLTKTTGYDKLCNVVSDSTCTKCSDELLRRARRLNFDQWYDAFWRSLDTFYRTTPHKNTRPGVRSKRVKDCLEWGGQCFADLLNQTAPRVKKIAERTLGPSPWLTSFHALILYPESDRSDDEVRRLRQGGLHTDFPYGEFKEKMDRFLLGSMKGTTQGRPMGHGDRGWQFPKGWRPGDLGGPHTMQTIWILDEFTEKRGGTALYPGSFAFKRVPNCGPGDDFDEFEKHAVTQTGSAGDVRSV